MIGLNDVFRVIKDYVGREVGVVHCLHMIVFTKSTTEKKIGCLFIINVLCPKSNNPVIINKIVVELN